MELVSPWRRSRFLGEQQDITDPEAALWQSAGHFFRELVAHSQCHRTPTETVERSSTVSIFLSKSHQRRKE
jgi:hypothetical protein